jgi:hypothetical protein
MSTTLRPFLAEIAIDPEKMAAFLADPDAMARNAGLDEADRVALGSANQGDIHARLLVNESDPPPPPPTQAPDPMPTQVPPTQAPEPMPTQVPPTQVPPTQVPPTQVPESEPKPKPDEKPGPTPMPTKV